MAWLSNPSCEALIEEVWTSVNVMGSPLQSICEHLQACRRCWQRLCFGNIYNQICTGHQELQVIDHFPNPVIGVQANTLKKQIEDFLDKEETMWCQCSRVRDDMSRAYTRPTPFNQVYP